MTTSTSTITGGASDGATEVINGLRWAVPGTDQFIDLGAFISAVINFLIIAFVVFCLVKGLNTMREKMDALAKREAEEEAAEEAAAPHCPYCLEEVKEGATPLPALRGGDQDRVAATRANATPPPGPSPDGGVSCAARGAGGVRGPRALLARAPAGPGPVTPGLVLGNMFDAPAPPASNLLPNLGQRLARRAARGPGWAACVLGT